MLTGMFRVGRDAQVRYTPSGDAVCSLSLAYDYGYGQKKGTQWVDGVMWGKMAETLSQYIQKGSQLYAAIDDLHIEEYKNSDGAKGIKLTGRVLKVTLVGKKEEGGKPETRQPQSRQKEGIHSLPDNDMDDTEGVPF